MIVSIIVAVAENGVIGAGNKLIWHLPEDLKNFKKLTTGHHIIMGRKTYESIGRPLPNRVSVIVTRNPDYRQEGCEVVNSIREAVELAENKQESEAFIIGGGQIYQDALPSVDKIYFTRVHHHFEGDVFFSELKQEEWNVLSEQSYQLDEKHKYSFTIYEMKRRNGD
jgi:dihydrofolate reductase